MKKAKQLTVLAIILVAPVIALASPPAIPLFVYGDVIIDNQPALVETEISAEIEGTEITVTIKTVKEGKYYMEIPDGKSNIGKTILFKVGDMIVADEDYKVADVNITPSVKFDLAVTTPSSPPPAPPAGGSSSGGSSTPSPVSPLSAAAQVVDTNGDDKIDILDFNSLVINWGKTGSSNVADFDNNGTVDIFDFNLLMTYWTG